MKRKHITQTTGIKEPPELLESPTTSQPIRSRNWARQRLNEFGGISARKFGPDQIVIQWDFIVCIRFYADKKPADVYDVSFLYWRVWIYDFSFRAHTFTYAQNGKETEEKAKIYGRVTVLSLISSMFNVFFL